MPPIEEVLREELKRVTEAAQPGQLRPLRAPAPGHRWRLLPVVAAATVTTAVVTIAVTAALLAGVPASRQSAAAPTPGPAVMPRYYVTMATATAGLEAVVHDSARGSVTGTVLLPETGDSEGQAIAAAANDRTFVLAANIIGASTVPGTVAMAYFRLSVSADGRPGTPVRLPMGLGNGEPLTGMALSPDGTLLALSLERFGLTTNVQPYGDVEVLNLATDRIRTWTGSSAPGYRSGAPAWENGDQTLAFTWSRIISESTGATVVTGIRKLDTAAPGGSLLAAPLSSFRTAVPGLQSAVVTAGGRDIIASSCRDTAASGGYHGTARAQVVELSAADGQLIRVLRTQLTRFPSTAAEQNALDVACAVLSVDPSGDHVLVQAFSFGRIDNGVFTALPGTSPGTLRYPAAAW